ncbi:UNVERIFIED_CONTAM: hypothetical protein K2H54_036060 [Gekko kuhli]
MNESYTGWIMSSFITESVQFVFFFFVFSGLYLAVIFYYKDNMLVTNEDQIPIVEIDDSHTSSIMQDFLWFTKVAEAEHVCLHVLIHSTPSQAEDARCNSSVTAEGREGIIIGYELSSTVQHTSQRSSINLEAGRKQQQRSEM